MVRAEQTSAAANHGSPSISTTRMELDLKVHSLASVMRW